MLNLAELLPVAREAADLGARHIRTHPPGRLTAKGDRDMASEVDYAVERALRRLLAERTPQIGFLGEEDGGSDLGRDATWVLDPLDGTANFVRGLPLCAVSLGLAYQGRAVLGVVALPYLDRTYWGGEGLGAWQDGRPAAPSAVTSLPEAMVALGDYGVGPGVAARNGVQLALTGALAGSAQRVRMLGSAAIDLVSVASGALDACIAFSNKPWDMMAGVAIARAAGASVVDADGTPHTFDSAATIAAPPGLVDQVLAAIAAARAGGSGTARPAPPSS
ncbi:MAG: inositol monophosphatase [Actinocatenispora sp.]